MKVNAEARFSKFFAEKSVQLKAVQGHNLQPLSSSVSTFKFVLFLLHGFNEIIEGSAGSDVICLSFQQSTLFLLTRYHIVLDFPDLQVDLACLPVVVAWGNKQVEVNELSQSSLHEVQLLWLQLAR